MRRSSILVLVIAGIMLLGGVWSCNSAQRVSSKLTAGRASGGVDIKSLDAADNPFRREYQEWDHWLVENINTPVQAFLNGDRPEDWISLTGYVNADGVLLPQIEATRLENERLSQGILKDYFSDYPFRVHVQGQMDLAMFRELGERQTSLRASFFPRVPDWLAADPPEYSILLPSGEVAATGLIGAPDASPQVEGASDTADDVHGCCGGSGSTYWLYSAAGEPLASTNMGHWWFIYFDERVAQMPIAREPLGEFNNSRKDGYVYFTDAADGSIRSVWDWDATLLAGTELPPTRSALNFYHISARQLQMMHKYQKNPIHDKGDK